MPGFTPGRRWQPAYSPFKKENFGDRALQVLEYSVKGPLFGCRMCGNCLLQETAFICPMECPKGCGTVHVAVQHLSIVMWIRPGRASGTRFMSGLSNWGVRNFCSKSCLRSIGKRWETDTWRDVFRSVAKIGVKKVVERTPFTICRDAQRNLGWDLPPGPPAGLVAG